MSCCFGLCASNKQRQCRVVNYDVYPAVIRSVFLVLCTFLAPNKSEQIHQLVVGHQTESTAVSRIVSLIKDEQAKADKQTKVMAVVTALYLLAVAVLTTSAALFNVECYIHADDSLL